MDILLWVELMDKVFLSNVFISTLLIMVFVCYTNLQDKLTRMVFGTALIVWYTIVFYLGLRQSPKPSFAEGRRKKTLIVPGEDPSLVDVQNRSDYLQQGNRKVRARLDGSDVHRIRARLVEAKTNDKEEKITLLHNTEEDLQTRMETLKENEIGEQIKPGPDCVEVQQTESLNSDMDTEKPQANVDLDSGKQLKKKKAKKSSRERRRDRALLASLLGNEKHQTQVQQDTSEAVGISQSEGRNEDEEAEPIATPNFIEAEQQAKEQHVKPSETFFKDGERHGGMRVAVRIVGVESAAGIQVVVQSLEITELTKSMLQNNVPEMLVQNQQKMEIQLDDEIQEKVLENEDNPENEVASKKKSSKKKKKKGRSKVLVDTVPDCAEHQTQVQQDTFEDSEDFETTAQPKITEVKKQEKEEYGDNKPPKTSLDSEIQPNINHNEVEHQENEPCSGYRQAETSSEDEERYGMKLADKNEIDKRQDVPESVQQCKDSSTNDDNKQTKSAFEDDATKEVDKNEPENKIQMDAQKQEMDLPNKDNLGNEVISKTRSSKKKKKKGRRTNIARVELIVPDSSEHQTQVQQDTSEDSVEVPPSDSSNSIETTDQPNLTDCEQEANEICGNNKPTKVDIDIEDKNAGIRLVVKDKITEQLYVSEKQQIQDSDTIKQDYDIQVHKILVLSDATPQKSYKTDQELEILLDDENDKQNKITELDVPEKQQIKDSDTHKQDYDIEEQKLSVLDDVTAEKSDKTVKGMEILLNDDEQALNKNDPETQIKNKQISSGEKNEKVLPEVSEAPKKSTRKQRKRKNPNKSKFKANMDDSSETSSNSDMSTKNDVQPEKTIIYSPLSLYLQLNMDMYILYHEFRNHLLNREQMKMYGFPEEAPDRPGRAIMRTQNVTQGSTERRCCRCGSVFNILPDGRYVSDTLCRYHARKQLPYRRGHPYRGDYPCCNGNYMSEGCVTWQYHVTAESALHDVEFVKTKNKKHLNEVTAGTVYALDCEMLYTTAGMEVAKVGIVGIDGLTVFESFVLPQNQILDYNTVYSGVTEKDLKGVTMTLVDVQTYLLKLLNQESVLVGHGLENDLKALRLIHSKIVDTSVVFPFQHTKVHKKSLKNLALEFLNKDIQQSANGHNCIEDARTCMELMLHRISSDIKERPPVTQDENKNSILQNKTIPEFHPAKYPVYQPWPYSCQYSYCSDSYRNSFHSGSLMSKNYNNCIYG